MFLFGVALIPILILFFPYGLNLPEASRSDDGLPVQIFEAVVFHEYLLILLLVHFMQAGEVDWRVAGVESKRM